ncbi:hypothetical protein N9B67_00900 [Algibacter sp.]|jgi:hypothetical protein|nr:hypothetical protein [Algibacter sp.]MDA9069257.1 hypothetical protein [Algibacter sp.]MDA9774855.1 hypothetical protein [Algibacter sp.]
METLKQRVRDYLEAQRLDYGNEEVEDSLGILEMQNDDLSSMGSFHKMLILRLIDDNELFLAIESAFSENEF